MINIFYNSISNGPGKVVTNLILGLQKCGIEYKTNQIISSEDKLLVLQDNHILYKETHNEKIIGPNICTLPIDNQYVMSQNYKKMIVPCEWVKQLYMKWLPEGKLLIWAVGINTDLFYDMSNNFKDNDCLIYFKRRNEEELNMVISMLESNNQTYEIIRYGNYSEQHFLSVLERSKYGIVIDKCESQGIAIQEMMSTNLPLLVWDTTVWDDRGEEFKIDATSVPYWNDRCGIKVGNFEELKNNFVSFIENLNNFNSREYILKNLDLENSAKKIIENFK